jgi:hypothetical protein
MGQIVAIEDIAQRIYFIRGVKVMLDWDQAKLYEVETRILKRNVRRHIKRFPSDFMFELSYQEFMNLRCQIGTSNRGDTRYRPIAFTEQSVAMLSGILNSKRAIRHLESKRV